MNILHSLQIFENHIIFDFIKQQYAVVWQH